MAFFTRQVLLAALLLVLPFGASAANGLRLISHYDNKHGTTGGVSYSGSWGYVAPDGREYAILGTASGTAIIDITDTLNIHEIAHVVGPTSIWREMRTYKNRLYIVSEGGNGTTIVDLSPLPAGVRVVKNFVYTSGTKNTIRSHTIEIFDGYMYLNGCANWGFAAAEGALIFSLADPDNPLFVGEYSPNYFHDSYVRHDTLFGASVYSGGGIYMADIHNKSAPVPIGKISYPGSGTHNLWATTNGAYLISTDEIGGTPKTLKFWDLQLLPAIPATPAATYQFSPSDVEHNVFVRGNYAYTAWYTAGIVVADIHNPTAPTTAGFYDTSNDSLYPPGNYDGVWAVYPYFWSGKITAGDMQNGLYVFAFDSLQPRSPVALLQPADQTVLCDQLPITFRWTRAANPVLDPHTYLLHLKGTGIDTSIDAGSDTLFSLANPALYGTGTISWNVFTKDEANMISSQDTFRILRPMPSVIAPNGGEIWKIHTQVNLQWHWTCTDSIELSYSTNSGVSWNFISNVPSGDSTYLWTVPIAPTTHGRFRVRDFRDSTRIDISDSNFTIFNSSAITIATPNGGELWKSGSTHQISWIALLVDSVGIDYSTDGGLSWAILVADTPASVNTYYWLIPPVSTAKAMVRITDRANWTVADTSDAPFTITPWTFDVAPLWNLVSLPVLPADPRSFQNFPGARSFVFGYAGSYQRCDSISDGTGYWVKYDSSKTLFAVGSPFTNDTIPVAPRWNIIGSLTHAIAVSSVTRSPGTMTLSPYYKYTTVSGYETADSLLPGRGYWVKASEAGSLILDEGLKLDPRANPSLVNFSDLSTLTIVNADGMSQLLYFTTQKEIAAALESYVLPPPAPAGLFDARYPSQRLVELLSAGKEIPITLSSPSYPITIRWNSISGAEPQAALHIDGGQLPLAGTGSTIIPHQVSRVTLGIGRVTGHGVPDQFALLQNYPNPFNPATQIRYDVRDAGYVSVKVFDLLGEEVANLVSENKLPGEYSVTWDAQGVTSGIYFCQMKAGVFSDTKKLVLLR